MRDLLVFLSFFGTIPLVFLNPHIGVLVWAWISYMNPHRLVPWGMAFDFRFALVCGVVTMIAWLLSREPKRLPINLTTILLLVLMAWLSVTTVFAVSPSAIFAWERAMKILLFTLVSVSLLQSRERIHAFVWVITVSIGFFGVKGALWFFAGGAGASGLVWGPPNSFISGNNELALALAMVIPLTLYLFSHSQLFFVRAGALMATVLCAVSIVGSLSRGAFLAGTCMAFVLVARSRRRVQLGLIVVVSLIGLAFMAPDRWFDRIETITQYNEDGSASDRILMWKFAWNLAKDRPIFGGGFNAFADPVVFSAYAPPGIGQKAYHSIYFQMLGDHGFAGLLIFLVLGISGFLSIRNVKLVTRNRPDMAWAGDLARMVEASLVAFVVGGIFYSLAVFDLYYHLLIIPILLRIVVERELANQEQPAMTLGPTQTAPILGHNSPHKIGA